MKEQVDQTPTFDCSRHSTWQSSEALPHHTPHIPKKFKNLRIVKCKSKYQKVAVQMQSCLCEELLQIMFSRCHSMCRMFYAMHHIDSEMQDLLGACLCILIFTIFVL